MESLEDGQKEAEPPGYPTTPRRSHQVKADEHHSHFSRMQTEAGAFSRVLGTHQQCDWSLLVLGPFEVPVSLPSSLAYLPPPICQYISKEPGEGRKMTRTLGAITAKLHRTTSSLKANSWEGHLHKLVN